MIQSNISLWYNRKWSFHKENLACKKVDLFKEPRFGLTATNVPNLSHCPAPLCLIRCQPSYTFELSTSFNRENDNNLYLSVDILDSLSFPHRWQEMSNSESEDNLDFQPLTQFLKCYGIYFQWPVVSSSWRRDITIMWTQDSNADFPWQYILYTRISCVCLLTALCGPVFF